MSNIINLNKARKARAKQAKSAQADANALRFGRSKAEKDLQTSRQQKANRDLDGHKQDEE